MHRHVSGLAKLRVPDREDALVEIDIAASQVERFRKPQAGGGDQSEDHLVGRWSQSTLRGKAPGGGEQIADLLLRVDVRRQASMRAAKDCGLRELGRRIKPRQIPCEWTKDVQAARPGKGLGVLGVTLHPIQGHAGRQRSGMARRVDEAGEGGDLVAGNAQIEPQRTALGQIILGQREHGAGRGHDALPGQGKATAASLVRSTLA